MSRDTYFRPPHSIEKWALFQVVFDWILFLFLQAAHFSHHDWLSIPSLTHKSGGDFKKSKQGFKLYFCNKSLKVFFCFPDINKFYSLLLCAFKGIRVLTKKNLQERKRFDNKKCIFLAALRLISDSLCKYSEFWHFSGAWEEKEN
jgi:hypothetical protein